VTILKASGRTAIGVLRYDRRHGRNGQVLRLHQEDFAQANGFPSGRKYERGTLRGLDLKTLLETGRHVSANDALALLDQVIFNILVANTDAHAKNYSLILPVAAAPRLAPLYDVSSVLPWPHVVQSYAQSIAGKKRTPDMIAGRHWERVARDIGYRPTDVRNRVQELVDKLVACRVKVTAEVAALQGATRAMSRRPRKLSKGMRFAWQGGYPPRSDGSRSPRRAPVAGSERVEAARPEWAREVQPSGNRACTPSCGAVTATKTRASTLEPTKVSALGAPGSAPAVARAMHAAKTRLGRMLAIVKFSIFKSE
jgi:hypothetical protein